MKEPLYRLVAGMTEPDVMLVVALVLLVTYAAWSLVRAITETPALQTQHSEPGHGRADLTTVMDKPLFAEVPAPAAALTSTAAHSAIELPSVAEALQVEEHDDSAAELGAQSTDTVNRPGLVQLLKAAVSSRRNARREG